MAVKESNERTMVTMSKELKEKLIKISEQNGRTLSRQIQFILQEYVNKNYKEELDNFDFDSISDKNIQDKMNSLSDSEFRYVMQSLLKKAIEDLNIKDE